ncbi:MAG TPA: hypothetical protein VHZ74_15585 [Bryobacteraceae bacterium]|nr:hypothetical protein [Bryobacteraceae bacterium]
MAGIAASRKHIVLAALLGGVLLAGGIVLLQARASREFFDQRKLLSRFPAEDALAMSIDFTTLRNTGLLGQAKVALEPDYKQFLEGTGFDYRRDLDSVAASFSRSGNFFIVRGRFDWRKLRDYTVRQGGSCYQDLCRMQGSKPERHISFLPLRKNAMALAVSANDLAVTRLTKAGPPVTGEIPNAPVWLSVPGSELRRQDALPPGMHLMLSALTNADRVIITVGTAGNGIEAHLDATCRTRDEAKVLASQLRSTTALIKEALQHDKQVADDELATLLTGGTFDQSDRRVTGTWPVRKSLLDALTSGI